MAFISSNKVKLRKLSDSGDPSAKTLLRLFESPRHFLTTLLISNNLVHVMAAAIFTYGMGTFYGIHNEWVVTALLTPIVLIFSEMVPKDYCRLRSQSFLLSYSGLLWRFSRLFHFPASLAMKVLDFFMGQFTQKSIFVNEEEFRSLIAESTRSGVVSQDEKRMIDTILDFEKIRVESVMVPYASVPKVSIESTVGEAKGIARKTKTKMLMVYEEAPEIVVGMIYIFDLLFEEDENQRLKNYLRAPIFISSSTSIERAFLTLQGGHQSFAVVTDRTNEVVGVVPIENLLAI